MQTYVTILCFTTTPLASKFPTPNPSKFLLYSSLLWLLPSHFSLPQPPPSLKNNLWCYLHHTSSESLSLHPAFRHPCSPPAPESPSGSIHLSAQKGGILWQPTISSKHLRFMRCVCMGVYVCVRNVFGVCLEVQVSYRGREGLGWFKLWSHSTDKL